TYASKCQQGLQVCVCTVLSVKSVQEIKMPPTHLDQRRTAHQFFRIKNFLRVIGAIDGTHIAIKARRVDEALYFNWKRFPGPMQASIARCLHSFLLSTAPRFYTTSTKVKASVSTSNKSPPTALVAHDPSRLTSTPLLCGMLLVCVSCSLNRHHFGLITLSLATVMRRRSAGHRNCDGVQMADTGDKRGPSLAL
ncbi:hypothetical protein O3P69_016294, partial [Scylla paramamosain]